MYISDTVPHGIFVEEDDDDKELKVFPPHVDISVFPLTFCVSVSPLKFILFV